MKVLMYGWEFPPHINGGLGIATYEIVQALLKRGVQVDLVLPKPNGTAVDASEHIHIDVIDSLLKPYMSSEEYCATKASLQQPIPYARDLFSEVTRYAELAGHLAHTKEFDVIHAHDWLTVRAGIYAKEITHKPLIFHVHSLETDRAGEYPNHAIFAIEQEGLCAADKIIAVSSYTKKMIIKHYGIAEHKIVVAYNGVPQEYLAHQPLEKTPHASKSVLFLGRITHQKGPFYFIEAAHKILQVRQDIQFVVAGEGDLLPSLIDYTTKLNITQHVHFVGFLDRKQVQAMYAQSQVYVMPSVSEPFGLTCLEALALHVPVVLSNQTGAAEVLPNVLKVDYWDITGMAEKILSLIDYPALGITCVQRSQKDLAALTWQRCCDMLIQVYQGV